MMLYLNTDQTDTVTQHRPQLYLDKDLKDIDFNTDQKDTVPQHRPNRYCKSAQTTAVPRPRPERY